MPRLRELPSEITLQIGDSLRYDDDESSTLTSTLLSKVGESKLNTHRQRKRKYADITVASTHQGQVPDAVQTLGFILPCCSALS